jgi:FKBP-type peptidyl-prolyl cis-trans isomerase (trigger factor)
VNRPRAGDRVSIAFRGLFTGNNIRELKRENMSAVVQSFG